MLSTLFGSFTTVSLANFNVEPQRMQKLQFLWHRFLVCLGDLARYKEQCEKPGRQKWSVPASHYSEATTVWPYNGNPQNQLAVLATYVGDEFLALYHCVRSLAVKEPFPDAWNNLFLLCEKNRSSSLPFVSDDAGFDFLKPASSVWKNGEQHDDSVETSFWILMIRVVSFFFVDSSLEEFPGAFASAVKELEVLLSLDDTILKTQMESYEHMDSAKRGPLRTLQVVCVLIFAIEHLRNNKEHKESTILSMQWALTATFIVMGRLVDRCGKANAPSSGVLLPAILVFMEWLLTVFDEVETHASSLDDRATSHAMSYFFGSLSKLLKQLDSSEKSVTTRPLWEDRELRGFAPLALPHATLDFSTHHGKAYSFEHGEGCRVRRILNAAKRIAERSNGNRHHGNGKSAALEEEEVILFKPLTRHNSAPIYNTRSSSFDNAIASSSGNQLVPADECLRRATSLLIAQNQAHHGDNDGGFTFHSDLSNFKRQPMMEHTVTSLFSEPTTISAGPPSLKAWVSPSSSHEKTNEKKHTLPPIDEAVVASSMSELTISDYSPPLPSAPLLPDDAQWANNNGGHLPVPHFLDHQHRPAGFSNWGLADGYSYYPPQQPPRRMTASEWLRQYRESQSRQQPSHTPPISMPLMRQGLPPIRDYYDEHDKRSSYWDGSLNEPEPLLQYLKEKEWLLHHQQGSNFRGPTFTGS
ncbi:Nonsense-mediated mRNA decay factor SMG7-like [Linum perenne]